MYNFSLFNIKLACEMLPLEIQKVVCMTLDYRLTRGTAGTVVLIQAGQAHWAAGEERICRRTTRGLP